MAKTRLTKADREQIRDAVIEHKFKPIDEAHAATGHALADEARSVAYGKFLANMDAAPEGAFGTGSYIKVNADGRHIRLSFSAPRRIFYRHAYYGDNILSLPASDGFGQRARQWAERGEEIKGDRKHLVSVTDGTLASFTTFDDLLLAWPEAATFINARWQGRPDYTANVPAVVIADLSAQLDLPPEMLEAA